MIRFGISRLPPDGGDDAAYLDRLVERGHTAHELPFVTGFPWKRDRCRRFGELAAERGIALSLHAPYFAVLTSDEEDKRARTLSSLEHALKLGKALGAPIIVAHAGYAKDRSPDQLMELVMDGLNTIAPTVAGLGVALGLETSGTERAFGSLGDIALIAAEFPWVRPVVDWAHLHAISGGKLTSPEAFDAVFAFLREHFPGWKIDPLHSQFTDNLFGPKGEIKHVPYGEGTLRLAPLAQAAVAAGLRMTIISEAREPESHEAILAELLATTVAESAPPDSRPLGSGRVETVEPVLVEPDADGYRVHGVTKPLRLSNIDKPFFPRRGYTKGDLIQYYADVAPFLLPHLAERAIVMARFPDGADGGFFYEKQSPSHRPAWVPTAPIYSGQRGGAIEFVTAPDRESLMWLANLGCIEIHPWLSRLQTVENPDFAIFDLDPADGASWAQVQAAAALVRVALERLGLRGYPKTSGASGIHVYVPLDPIYPYGRVRRFVEAVGRLMVAADPEALTMEWDIPRRAGKVFIDHNQNVGGKTIASVYSVRPVPEAAVSMPLLWEEVDGVVPNDFTIANASDRLSHLGDAFAPVLAGGQRLEAAEEALGLDPVRE